MNKIIPSNIAIGITVIFAIIAGAFILINNNNNIKNLNQGINALQKYNEETGKKDFILKATTTEKTVQENIQKQEIITSKNTDQISCEKAGGIWQQSMDLESFNCIITAKDTNKSCTDSSQCDIYCQAPQRTKTGDKVTGYCSDYTKSTCNQEVRNGVAGAEKCQ